MWCFLGDGECDEPESLGAITLASREKLDNLIFVINCNLQRLDGPVRGNGKIIQELEGRVPRRRLERASRSSGASDWDPLLAKDDDGMLAKRMGEVVDGQYQKYVVAAGDYIREHFFGKYPELQRDGRAPQRRAAHVAAPRRPRSEKVYAAYKAATDQARQPTVILAKTIKGYGLGEEAEGRNVAHNAKKFNETSRAFSYFRDRFGIPIVR